MTCLFSFTHIYTHWFIVCETFNVRHITVYEKLHVTYGRQNVIKHSNPSI